MSTRPVLAGLALVTVLAARVTMAQTVHGVRIDSLTDLPVEGGFVVLLDDAGREVARALAGYQGRFAVAAPRAGTYRLRSERIGYYAALSSPIVLADGQTLLYTFRVMPVPVRLDAIEVREQRRCGADRGSDSSTVLVWEEIRKALTATSWTSRGTTEYRVRLLRYERDLDGQRRRVERATVQTASGRLRGSPFSSLPADQLARRGFVIQDNDEVWYYGPDAEVLLDDAFLETHCFHVVRPDDRDSALVGLAFEPTPGRDLPDVVGVLWLDERSSELQQLEYRFTNVPYRLTDDRVGGTVEFLQLPFGAWIVREWVIRTPLIAVAERRDPILGRRQVARVTGFRDTGGEVLAVTTRDGASVYEAPLARLAGTVTDSTTGLPLANARVAIGGTDFSAGTDSTGAFELAAPVSGAYDVTLVHPWLDSIAYRPPALPVSLVRGVQRQLSFAVPHADSVRRRLCPDDEHEAWMVHGTVRRHAPAGPVPAATVTARWQTVARAGDRLHVRNVRAEATTDAAGRFVLCNVAADRPVTIQAHHGELVSRVADLVLPRSVDGDLLLAWDRAPGGLYEESYLPVTRGWFLHLELTRRADEAPAPAARGSLRGVVSDGVSGRRLADVEVLVNGSVVGATRPDGTFEFLRVAWTSGANRLAFRRPGYQPLVHDLWLEDAGAAVELGAVLQPESPELAGIVVEGERLAVLAKLRGFSERRAQ